MGIQAIEIGFPASSKMDFDSCCLLVQNAPKNITLSVLARIVPEAHYAGRTDGESFEFTNQSGKAGLKCLCSEVGISLSAEQLTALVPKAKHLAEEKGELSPTDVSQLCLKNH